MESDSTNSEFTNTNIDPSLTSQKVFICDSKSSRVIRATITWDDKCQDFNKSHLGVIEVPADWIGKRVYIRPFEIVRM